ncbi:hypothetical protein ABZW11_15215 [Nonomuraea sp. NPDC004580]|uniref:hypothetical protein n=1 Tax=Nonomuraea sp. NPDC004580 TaxID=3154552 RepID=UPI0033B1C51A
MERPTGRRWVGVDGWEVVGAVRAGRQVLRVRRNGWVVADCTSVAEVASLVDLADLCEVVEFPRRPVGPLADPLTDPVTDPVTESSAGSSGEGRTSSHHR